MTSNTKQLRAVFLAALMVLSVFAGTVAFAGSAAAVDSGTVDNFDPDNLDEGTQETHTFNVSYANYDGGDGTDTVDINLPSSVTVDSYDVTVYNESNSSNIATASGSSPGTTDLSVDFGQATTGSNNATIWVNGTVTITAPSVDKDTDANVWFNVSDATDGMVNKSQTVTINDLGATSENPRYLESVHWDNFSSDNNAQLEIAFSEPVTGVNNIQWYVDEKPMGTLGSADVSDNGRYVWNLSEVYTGDVEVKIPASVEDLQSNDVSNTGNKTVDVAPVTVKSGDVNAYKGSSVAVVADAPDTDIEVEAGDDEDFTYFQSGSTGTNSQVYVFGTQNRDVGQYNVSVAGTADVAEINVRDLGLEVSVDDLNVTNEDVIEGTVSANAGERPIEVELLDSDEDTVATIGADLTGQAEYDYEFNASELELDEDNYTVLATDNQSGVDAESSSIVVSDAGEGRADIGGSGIITDERGDVVNITITLQNTDYATLTLGSSDVGYRSNVTVEDENGDGQVNLLFNTWAATNAGSIGNDGGNVYDVPNLEDDDDSITKASIEEGVNSLLESGEYDLEVRAGQDSDDDSQGVGTLTLEERNTTAVNTWTAPSGSTLEDTDDVYEAVGNNNLTQTNTVAYGDLAVHQVEASGLEGLLEAQGTDDVTTAFYNNNGSEYTLTVEQVDPGANRDPYALVLNDTNSDVFADSENDTYFVVYDTDSKDIDTTERSIENDHTLEANFTVEEDEDNLADDRQTVTDEYDLVEGEHILDDPYNVSASAEQTIEGETTVAPGTELSLRVRSSGDTQPSFLKTATVYVTENRTFSGTFDFSEQEVGDTYEITVRNGPADSETVDGTVLESVETETEMTETDAPDTATDAPDTATDAPDTATDAPDTATEAPGTDTEAPGTDTGTSTGTPGFGVVVAVTALLAAALLAVRRD
ncbi:PGF-CTERM protein/surface glycoprotein [Halogeometricum rufum]|uniref:PGF-CTERM protein/surface glycoprotein n=1 Tax=Halogeometricum rufum TaxID=553469 RepID=A0A1I6G1C0_9EURY|nr:BGTF surface domain-containing protein [Halogeometricum rufum]SFR35940.1 PGF-CTERM protein/surface glycoprotein [Halogeometricum rufum]